MDNILQISIIKKKKEMQQQIKGKGKKKDYRANQS